MSFFRRSMKMSNHSKLMSVPEVLRAISDDKSLVLFNTIRLASGRSDIRINTLKLTRKQYYSRMSGLIKAELIKRQNGKYFLTSFGKIIYDFQEKIQKAVQNYWKLKALDSFEVYPDENHANSHKHYHKLSIDERKKIIDTV